MASCHVSQCRFLANQQPFEALASWCCVFLGFLETAGCLQGCDGYDVLQIRQLLTVASISHLTRVGIDHSCEWPVHWAMAVPTELDAGWGSVVQDLVASQDSEASLLEEAEACRSSTDTSDSLPDSSLWWVNPLKGHSSGFQRPVPPRTPRTLLSGCTGAGADIMVLKARREVAQHQKITVSHR